MLKVYNFITNLGSYFEFYNCTTFTVLPTELIFATVSIPLKNVFFFILSNLHDYCPTYRLTNRYNKKIKVLSMEINKIRYPQDIIKNESDNSLENDDYLDLLFQTIPKEISAINKYNFALNSNTSEYVTKTIFDVKTNPIVFYREAISKCMLGINLEALTMKAGIE